MELTGADELDLVSAFGQHSGPYAHTVSCDERNRSVHRAINPSLCRSSVVYLPNGLRQQGTRCPVRRTAGRSGQPVRPWPWRPIRAVAAERSKSPRVVPASQPRPSRFPPRGRTGRVEMGRATGPWRPERHLQREPRSAGFRPCGLWTRSSYLVDPASSHMLVSKIKPCMSKYRPKEGETANGSLNQLWFIGSYHFLLG